MPTWLARKSEPLIEALRIDAGVMGEQLDQLAAPRLRLADRPLHELLADAAAAAIGSDADILDQAARGALRAQARQDAELQAADDAARASSATMSWMFGSRSAARRRRNRRRQRLLEPLAGAAEMIVGEHRHDGSDVARGARDEW